MKDAAGTRTSERANRREATGPKGEGRDSPSTFPKYPEYKDSGVEWLGEVPAHWVVGPLRWYATIQGGVAKGKSYSDDTPTVDLPYLRVANVQDGHVELSSVNTVTVALSEVDRYRLQPGDVLMNEGGDNDKLGRGTVWQGEIADCLHQNHVFAIRPNQYLLPYWLSMFTRSSAARSYFYLYSKQSTNLASISSSNVMSCPLPLPPAAEQRQILSFLDNETARIDALVEEQERLIELLKEKRQAVISHAVTKGLDPDVPMKDSGVVWLGEVPAHWVRKRLKNVSPFITVGIVVNPSSYLAEEGLPFIYGGEVREGYIEVDKARKISVEDSRRNRKTMLEAGDVVTMRVGYPGVTSVVPPECEGGNCASVMLIKKGGYDSRWLCALMNSRLIRHQVEVVQYGAAQKQFNIADAVEFWLFEPPLDEQAKWLFKIYRALRPVAVE